MKYCHPLSRLSHHPLSSFLCLADKYSIKEDSYEDYSSINANILFDGNTDSCVNLLDTWTFLPMTSVQQAQNGSPTTFSVVVTVHQSFLSRANSIMVITKPQTNIAYPYKYKKCQKPSASSLTFECQCDDDCFFYVRIFFKSMAKARSNAVRICEIQVT